MGLTRNVHRCKAGVRFLHPPSRHLRAPARRRCAERPSSIYEIYRTWAARSPASQLFDALVKDRREFISINEQRPSRGWSGEVGNSRNADNSPCWRAVGAGALSGLQNRRETSRSPVRSIRTALRQDSRKAGWTRGTPRPAWLHFLRLGGRFGPRLNLPTSAQDGAYVCCHWARRSRKTISHFWAIQTAL